MPATSVIPIPTASDRFELDPDGPLVKACLEDPEANFPLLHARFEADVYRCCLRATGNRADAEDATQETFLILHRKLGTFRFRARFSSWVYRLSWNTGVSVRRRATAAAAIRGVAGENHARELAQMLDEQRPPDAACELDELRGQVRRAVRGLPPGLRRVIRLRYGDGQPYAEIATRLDLPVGTVKSRLSRSHRVLQMALFAVNER